MEPARGRVFAFPLSILHDLAPPFNPLDSCTGDAVFSGEDT